MDDTSNLFMSQVTLSAIIVWLLHRLEQWKALPPNTPAWVKRFLAWGAALVAALGLHWEFDATTGLFALTGSIQGLAGGLWMWLQSIVVQEGIHQTTKAQSGVKDFLKTQGGGP